MRCTGCSAIIWRSFSRPRNWRRWLATKATIASKALVGDIDAAELFGDRDDADRQRLPGADGGGHAALPLAAGRRGNRARPARTSRRRCRTSARRPTLSSIRSAQPVTASDASVWRSTISSARPSSRSTRAMNSSPFAAARQASVAIRRMRVGSCSRSLLRHRRSASMVRSIAASDSRPVADRPSPSRTMRVKPSSTRKLCSCGRAISRRQLLVPRSSAA